MNGVSLLKDLLFFCLDLKRENQSCQSTYCSQNVPTINITDFCNSIFEKLNSHFKNEGEAQVKQQSLDTDFKNENKDNSNIVMGNLQNLKELYDSIEKICKNVFNDSTLTKDSNPQSGELSSHSFREFQGFKLPLMHTDKK